jgi:hypothetical protein
MNNFNNFSGSSFGNASQYQGFQKQYQPVGQVPSFYGQSSAQSNQAYGQQASPEQYHTANYRGNQLGHDNYLRADSTNPSQQQTGAGFQSGYSSFNNFNSGAGQNNVSSQFGFSQSPYSLRSSTPFSNQTSSQFSNQANQFGQFGRNVSQNQQYGQATSPESYHTANYRGNQLGHDNYLRADSQNPAQQQFGTGFQGGYNAQNQNFSTGINNVGQQFGYNSAY